MLLRGPRGGLEVKTSQRIVFGILVEHNQEIDSWR